MSDTFPILNGTWQGYPLSPITFILTLEPFLRTIRSHQDIKGVHTKGGEHKLAAYADNLIFFVTFPLISLPNLMAELHKYGELSNFKMIY